MPANNSNPVHQRSPSGHGHQPQQDYANALPPFPTRLLLLVHRLRNPAPAARGRHWWPHCLTLFRPRLLLPLRSAPSPTRGPSSNRRQGPDPQPRQPHPLGGGSAERAISATSCGQNTMASIPVPTVSSSALADSTCTRRINWERCRERTLLTAPLSHTWSTAGIEGGVPRQTPSERPDSSESSCQVDRLCPHFSRCASDETLADAHADAALQGLQTNTGQVLRHALELGLLS